MWASLLNAVGLRRYRRQLEGVQARARVRVRARVASANAVRSPVTDMRAALMRYAIGERWVTTDRNGREYEHTVSFGEAIVFEDLLLECPDGHVVIPTGCPVMVKFDGDGFSILPSFAGELPTEVAHLVRLQERGQILYAEQTLRTGDPVELLALVEPAERHDLPLAQQHGYRDAATARVWQAVAVKGDAPRLRDLSLEDVKL